MTDTQARLIASALVLVAGAVLWGPSPSAGQWVMLLAGILFVVEYVRTQLPAGPGDAAEPGAAADRAGTRGSGG
jgi:hypothetical protein